MCLMIAYYRICEMPVESHPPPTIASPMEDPPPVPWEYCASNATGFPTHFEELSLHILPLAHSPSSSIGVMGIRLNIMDLCMHNKVFLLKYLTPSKNICVFYSL
jgi:hypothetical protein